MPDFRFELLLLAFPGLHYNNSNCFLPLAEDLHVIDQKYDAERVRGKQQVLVLGDVSSFHADSSRCRRLTAGA